MPNEQKTLRSVVATWRAALVLVCFSGSTGDENTILLPFRKRGLREGQCVNIIDERP